MALGQGALSEQPIGGQPAVTTGYVAPTGNNVTADLKGSYVPPTANAIQGSLGDAPASVSFSVSAKQAQKVKATASAANAGASVAASTKQGQKAAATATTSTAGTATTRQGQRNSATVAAASAGIGSHQDWRINVTANNGDTTFLAIAEMEMRATVGGADQCVGGAASASTDSNGVNPASFAFDNDNTTRWSTTSGAITGWLRYRFASPVAVAQYTIRSHPDWDTRSPKDWTLEYSDDNGATWTVADRRTGYVAWEKATTKSFTVGEVRYSGSFLVDSSPVARTLTAQGPAASSAIRKFGSHALDASDGGSVIAADHADWMLPQQFTVEAWVYLTSNPGNGQARAIVGQYNKDFPVSWYLRLGTDNSPGFAYATTDNVTTAVSGTSANAPALNTWAHVAVDRDASNVMRVYMNGAVVASATVTQAIWDSARPLRIGNVDSGERYFPGYIDEVRITRGVARYAGAFTPPTAAFPNNLAGDPHYNSVALLAHFDEVAATEGPSSSVAVTGRQAQRAGGTLTAITSSSVTASTRQGQKASATAGTAIAATITTKQGQRASATLLAQSVGSFTVATKQGQRSAATASTASAATASTKQGQKAAATGAVSVAGSATSAQAQKATANLFASTPVAVAVATKQAQKTAVVTGVADAPQAGPAFQAVAYQGTPFLQLRNRNLTYEPGAFQAQPYAMAKPYNDAAVAPVTSTVSANTSQAQRTDLTGRLLDGPEVAVATRQAQQAAAVAALSVSATVATKQREGVSGTAQLTVAFTVAARQAQKSAATAALVSTGAASTKQAQGAQATASLTTSLSVATKQGQKSAATASLSSSMAVAMAQAERANAQLLLSSSGAIAAAQRQGSAGTLGLDSPLQVNVLQAQVVAAQAGVAAAFSVASRQAQQAQATVGQSIDAGVVTRQRQGNSARSRLESGDGSVETAQAQGASATASLSVAMAVATRQGQKNGAVVGLAADSTVAAGQAQHIGNTTFLVLESIVGVATAQSQQSATGTLEQYVPAIAALEADTTLRPAVTGSARVRLPLSATFSLRPATAGRAKSRPIP